MWWQSLTVMCLPNVHIMVSRTSGSRKQTHTILCSHGYTRQISIWWQWLLRIYGVIDWFMFFCCCWAIVWYWFLFCFDRLLVYILYAWSFCSISSHAIYFNRYDVSVLFPAGCMYMYSYMLWVSVVVRDSPKATPFSLDLIQYRGSVSGCQRYAV